MLNLCSARSQWFLVAPLSLVLAGSASALGTAQSVVAYDPGTETDRTDTNAALGLPDAATGFGVLSPFNPAFSSDQILRMQGEDVGVTFQLSHYALPTAGLELGVISNFGITDISFPNGQAGDPASSFSQPRQALVEVSENGVDFVSLGTQVFDLPANYFTDLTDPFSATPGAVTSDFGKPFDGELSDFDGLDYGEMITLLDASVGGTWLDISATGLSQVGYVRFTTVADNDYDFIIDSLLIADAATGAVIPEPAAALTLVSLLGLVVRRRQSRA